MPVQHIVRLYSSLGANQQIVPDFISLKASVLVNDVGSLELVIPVKYYSFLQIDGIVEIERAPDNHTYTLLFETRWLIRYYRKGYDSSGTYLVTIIAFSAIHLLKRRIVAYAAQTTQTQINAVAADNALKTLVSQNLGGGATDTARSIASILSIQASTTLAPVVTKSFAWQDMLPVMQDICFQSYQAGTNLYFDVVALSSGPTQFEFRTYIGQRGVDRRFPGGLNPLLLDVRLGNLSEAYVEYDYREERNYIYGLGQGEASQRATKFSLDSTRINASVAGRIEGRRDARNISDPNSVQGETDAELRDKRGRKNFQGQISETPTTIFGVTFGFGDYLTANLDNEGFDVMLEAMTVEMVRNGKETINATVKSPVS